MRPSQYQELEKDNKFKKYYLQKTSWWKNYLLLPPIPLLFIGLAGIMHLGSNDQLWTWYLIPYLAIFLFGTVLLKASKKHIQNKILNDKKSLLTCAARAIGDKGARYYFIFSNENKRQNETLINRLASELSIDSFTEEELNRAKKGMVEISTSETETHIYLAGIKVDKVLRTNRENIGTGITPLLYANPKQIFVIRNKDLK